MNNDNNLNNQNSGIVDSTQDIGTQPVSNQNVSPIPEMGSDMMNNQNQVSSQSVNMNNTIDPQPGQVSSDLVSGVPQDMGNIQTQTTPNLMNFNTESNSNNSSQNMDSNSNKKKFNFNFKINKKIIIIACAVVLALIVIIVVIKSLLTPKTIISPMFDPKSPIIIEENNKYGYINNKGKVLVQPIYDYADDFFGEYAIVKVKTVENNTQNTLYEIIDKKGNVKATSENSSGIKYIDEYDVWVINDQLYNKKLKLISGNGTTVDYLDSGYFEWENKLKRTAGVMNYKGKKTYTYNLTSDEDYLNAEVSDTYGLLDENYCIISLKNKTSGIINCKTGKVVYNFGGYSISDEDYNVFTIEKAESYDFISTIFIKNNKIAYQTDNKNIEVEYYGDNYLVLEDDSKSYSEQYSYLNLKTNVSSKEKPTIEKISELSAWQKSSAIKEFSCDNGKGLMKKDKVVLACEYSDIDYFGILLSNYLDSKGKRYIMAEKGDKTYLINVKNMKPVQEFNSKSVYDSSYSTFIYYTDGTSKNKIVYNLLSKKTITVDKDSDLDVGSNYITITKDKKTDYYNTDLKLIYTVDNNKTN